MYIKIVWTIINKMSVTCPKEVSKSSYPSEEIHRALPTITVTSGPGFTGLTEARLLVNKCNGMLKDPVCANVDVWFVVYSGCFPMTAKTGLKQHGKAQGRAQRKGCERQPAGNKWSFLEDVERLFNTSQQPCIIMKKEVSINLNLRFTLSKTQNKLL